jgi:ArsR family transcriptional regulator, arsenate/arsenite/antimonite-responsive transcriptional repressor
LKGMLELNLLNLRHPLTMNLETLANQYKALGHPARLRIVNLLAQQESLCVCELMRVCEFGQSFSSRHLAILREAGLVETDKVGTWVHYHLTPACSKLLSNAGLSTINVLQADCAQLNNIDCSTC